MPAAPNRSASRDHRVRLIAVSVACSLLVGVGVASGSGGLQTPEPPEARDAHCLKLCLDVREVAETGKVEITGKNLAAVNAVKLGSGDGKQLIEPTKVQSSRVQFVVPAGTGSGKPVVIDEYGNRSRAPVRLEVQPEDAIDPSGAFAVKRTDVDRAKTFFHGKRRSKVEYLFEADGPTDVRIDVLKGKRGKLVDSIVKRDQEPFANHSAGWDGLSEDGRVGPNGKYNFEVSELSGGDGEQAKFRYYDHKFPLRASHGYGDGLGAGRNHRGQDVFAACGAKVVAARGGRVQTRAYHGAAGYYVVIDGRKTGVDYVYMHLSRKGRPKLGAKVKTGERIGFNDDTGNASGCHVHFEMWSAPGWYEGGKVLDPTRSLKRWDRWS